MDRRRRRTGGEARLVQELDRARRELAQDLGLGAEDDHGTRHGLLRLGLEVDVGIGIVDPHAPLLGEEEDALAVGGVEVDRVRIESEDEATVVGEIGDEGVAQDDQRTELRVDRAARGRELDLGALRDRVERGAAHRVAAAGEDLDREQIGIGAAGQAVLIRRQYQAIDAALAR